MMNRRFSSGKAQLIGRGIVYPVPIPLDAAAYKGAFVAGLDPADGKVKPYFSDGTEWTRNVFDTEIQTIIQQTVDDLTLVGYDEEDLPNPLLAVNLRRFAFNNDRGVPGFVWEDEWKYLTDEARVAEIAEDVAANVVRIADEEIIKTVGPGGDFAELDEAVAFFGAFSVGAAEDLRFVGRIRVLSGYVATHPIRQVGTDLTWVLLESDDDEIVVANTAYTLDDDGAEQQYAFWQAVNSGLPQLHTLFVCGNANWKGADNDLADAPGLPIDGKELRGIMMRNSRLFMPYFVPGTYDANTGVKDFSINVSARGGSFARLLGDGIGGDFSGARKTSLEVRSASSVTLRSCVVRGAVRSILLVQASSLYMETGDATGGGLKGVDYRRTEGEDSVDDIEMARGSTLSVASSNTLGYAPPAGQVTNAGIVFDTRQTGLQSGSNANGEFVRFADGTQICYSPVFSGAATTAQGSLWRWDADQTWTFPAAFVSAPVVSPGSADNTTGGHLPLAFAPGASSVSVNVLSTASLAGRTATFVAVGRWF